MSKGFEMHHDDRPTGRLLSRRELVALIGASAAAAMAHRAGAQSASSTGSLAPGCVVRPQQTEGPYFVDERLLRSDIRSDARTGEPSEGLPLELALTIAHVTTAGACAPLSGAQVDIWHCDAAGLYSDVQDRRFSTKGRTFLRGYQITDGNGLVRFTTIYPGWYPGRAVHIHFKVRTAASSSAPAYEFTSQFYFDERLSDRVFARQPYAAHAGERTRNERDFIFRNGGTQLTLLVTEGPRGYAASFTVGMRPGDQAPRRRRRV